MYHFADAIRITTLFDAFVPSVVQISDRVFRHVAYPSAGRSGGRDGSGEQGQSFPHLAVGAVEGGAGVGDVGAGQEGHERGLEVAVGSA